MPLSGRQLPVPAILRGGAQPSVLSAGSTKGMRAVGEANKTVSAMSETLQNFATFKNLEIQAKTLEVEREKIALRDRESKTQLDIVERSYKLKDLEIQKQARLIKEEQLRQFAENDVKREHDFELGKKEAAARMKEYEYRRTTAELTANTQNFALNRQLELAKGLAYWAVESGSGAFPPIETLRASPFQTMDGLVEYDKALKKAEGHPTAQFGAQYMEDRIGYYGMLHEGQFTLGEGESAESFTVAEVIDLLGDIPGDTQDPATTTHYQGEIRKKFYKLGWDNDAIDNLQEIQVPEFSNTFNLKPAGAETYSELATFLKEMNTELEGQTSPFRDKVMQESLSAWLKEKEIQGRVFFPPDVLQNLREGAGMEVPLPTRTRAANSTGKGTTFTERFASSGASGLVTAAGQASPTGGTPPVGTTSPAGVTVSGAQLPMHAGPPRKREEELSELMTMFRDDVSSLQASGPGPVNQDTIEAVERYALTEEELEIHRRALRTNSRSPFRAQLQAIRRNLNAIAESQHGIAKGTESWMSEMWPDLNIRRGVQNVSDLLQSMAEGLNPARPKTSEALEGLTSIQELAP